VCGKFKFLGATLTIKNSIHEEITSRLNSGNACHHSVWILKSPTMKTYARVTFPVLLCGCETLSLTMKEGKRLRVSENRREPRNIYGSRWDKILGDWMKLHNEMLHDLQYSPLIILATISKRMRYAGLMAHMGERRGAHMVLLGKPEGKKPLGTPRCRWEGNIKMDS